MAQEKSCIRETLNLLVDAVKKAIFFWLKFVFAQVLVLLSTVAYTRDSFYLNTEILIYHGALMFVVWLPIR